MSEGLEIQNTSPVTTTGFRAAESCARDIFVEALAISGRVVVVTEGRRRAAVAGVNALVKPRKAAGAEKKKEL